MLPHAKKSFGQNFLNDPSVVKKIIAAAGIAPGDAVLEIGPGTGVLTQALVDVGAHVTAIEADGDLIGPLQKKFGERINLIHADVLSVPFFRSSGALQGSNTGGTLKGSATPPMLDGAFKLVANLPYNITSDFFQTVFKAPHKPSRMVVMVQREVADRIVAKPPDMSLLTVVCQLYAECKKVLNVPAGAFRPIPKVDSAVVRMDLFQRPPLAPPYQPSHKASAGPPKPLAKEDKGGETRSDPPPLSAGGGSAFGGQGGDRGGLGYDVEQIIALAKAGFSSKRKQLHNNLTAAGYGDADKIKVALKQLGYREDARAENVHTKDWIGLSLLL